MRRHTFLYILLLSVCLLSCGTGRRKSQGIPPAKSQPAADTLTADSFRYEAENEYGSCEGGFDYPVAGPPAAVESIRSFIRSQLFEHRTTDVPTHPDEMVHAYCQERLPHFDKALNQMQARSLLTLHRGRIVIPMLERLIM